MLCVGLGLLCRAVLRYAFAAGTMLLYVHVMAEDLPVFHDQGTKGIMRDGLENLLMSLPMWPIALVITAMEWFI